MDRREFLIRVGIICALPNVEAFIPTAALADDACSNNSGGGPFAPGFPWQAMEGVASNLAFALPTPYGAFAAAALGAIFAGITTDGAGTLKAMQTMLDQAVCALESYMKLLNVTAIESDIQAFFAWVNDNTAQFNSQTVWSPESIDEGRTCSSS